MKYPAILYKRENVDVLNADNVKYSKKNIYEIIAIYRNPDDDLPDKILDLPYCEHQRFYISDNLNHDVFRLYF